ncbi:hypothetical protein NUH88_17500 [Nisaea acidiphila]|uniref:Uncharacterized protein n=1 Tax=Nisaea acidiphila TaxID=1862145 RepID=A0A9J7AS81_9PROT|nr:hypothetical protein [Nisaea acidiphila]UUX49188.1 hypothetical protein NUH88_17500 [Nisaea acidiphila]
MSGSGAGSTVLDSLRADFDKAMAQPTTLQRYRALQSVVAGCEKLHKKVTRNLKENQKDETYLEAEKRYITKHETKLDALAQGLFRCYESPGKARETLDRLCGDYDTNYALEVVRLGIRRLAKPVGLDILGIKSEGRRVAEEYFESTLLPSLEKLIPDHGDYIKLKRLDVDERYEKVLHEIEMGRQAVAAVEAGLKKYRKELETAAKALTEEEVGELSTEELAERLMILPPKMREAILDAKREAMKKPRDSL